MNPNRKAMLLLALTALKLATSGKAKAAEEAVTHEVDSVIENRPDIFLESTHGPILNKTEQASATSGSHPQAFLPFYSALFPDKHKPKTLNPFNLIQALQPSIFLDFENAFRQTPENRSKNLEIRERNVVFRTDPAAVPEEFFPKPEYFFFPDFISFKEPEKLIRRKRDVNKEAVDIFDEVLKKTGRQSPRADPFWNLFNGLHIQEKRSSRIKRDSTITKKEESPIIILAQVKADKEIGKKKNFRRKTEKLLLEKKKDKRDLLDTYQLEELSTTIATNPENGESFVHTVINQRHKKEIRPSFFQKDKKIIQFPVANHFFVSVILPLIFVISAMLLSCIVLVRPRGKTCRKLFQRSHSHKVRKNGLRTGEAPSVQEENGIQHPEKLTLGTEGVLK